MKIGNIVLWRSPIRDGESTSPDFPAIVYEVKDEKHLALVVFGYDNIPVHRFGYVPYSVSAEKCWRKLEEV